MSYQFKRLSSEVTTFKNLLKLFATVFEEPETYQSKIPSDKYLEDFLNDFRHIVLVAQTEEGEEVVGGLVAYVLQKFEQERKEIFVYDLAVAKAHRQKGIATKLIGELKPIATQVGASLIFVQADKGDEVAVSFYRSLKPNEEVEAHNFDIIVGSGKPD